MHKLLHHGTAIECYRCGVVCDDGPGASDAIDAVACAEGGYDHPPYLLGLGPNGETGLVETCAAHPYQACESIATLIGRVGN